MGRQISTFMHPDDLAELQSEVERRGDVTVYAGRFATPSPPELSSSLVVDYGHDNLRVYLGRRDESSKIIVKATDEYRYIDSALSPVVEFDRPYFDGSLIRAGRMWYSTGAWIQGSWLPASPEFMAWADSWLRWIRRRYRKLDSVTWVGPHAAAWATIPDHRLEH